MQRRVRGLFVLCVSAGISVSRVASAEEDLVLDLGGEKLAARHVTHGSFTMGSSPGETGHERDEEPPHQVTITKDYWMGKSPITRGQFAKFVADTRYVTDAEKGGAGGAGWDGKQLTQRKDFSWRTPGFTQTDDHPVVLVTFGDAIAFTGWASRKTGKRVRLPSEAEWEYAARASTSTPYYVAPGEGEVTSIGWFKPNAGNGTRPVEQKKPNPLGIFDMSGNVFEWCRDVYAPYHEGAAVDPEITAGVAGEPERRVLRGGSWLRDPKRGRSAARHRGPPNTRNADNGFRVVVTNDEDVTPGVGGGLSPDFAPAAPVGVGSAGPLTPIPPMSSNGRIDDTASRDDARQPQSDALSWGVLLASPLAAASAVVAWMLLRRRRPSTSPATRPVVRVPQARPASSATPASRGAVAPPLPARAHGPAPSPPARPVVPLDLMPPSSSRPQPPPPSSSSSSSRGLGRPPPSPQSAPPVPLTLPTSGVAAPPVATAHPTASAAPPASAPSPPSAPVPPVPPPPASSAPVGPPAPPSSRSGPPSKPPLPLQASQKPTLKSVPEEIEPEEDDDAPKAPVPDPFLVPYVDKEESADALSSPPAAPNAGEAKAEEPKPEEPKAEEPKPEEPKAEEPKAEEAKAEEPKAEEPKPEEPKPEEPKPEEPKPEAPKPEEPKPEEPEPEAPKPEEPEPEAPKPEAPKAEEEAKPGDPLAPPPPASDPEGVQVTEPLHFKPPAPDAKADEGPPTDAREDDERKKQD